MCSFFNPHSFKYVNKDDLSKKRLSEVLLKNTHVYLAGSFLSYDTHYLVKCIKCGELRSKTISPDIY